PLRRFRNRLAARNARDLSPVPADDLPSEIAPMASTLNRLLDRLKAAFDAERSFAANAAHELRTPLAGAIAQVQRLRSETLDPEAARRGAEIEEALKRLTRLSEKMLQLARAEGGRLRTGDAKDLRPVLGLVVSDFARAAGADRFDLVMSDTLVLSDLDPDTFGILCR
ncbi:two-component sensor histidine kinase, partial [Amaricoccus sp. HAR-UPW-R2A-40]